MINTFYLEKTVLIFVHFNSFYVMRLTIVD